MLRLPCVLLAATVLGMLTTACGGTLCSCRQGESSVEVSVASAEECYALAESPQYDSCYPAELAAGVTSPLGAGAAGNEPGLWDSTLTVRTW